MTETVFPLPPNAAIGIVGGGQLGRMLASDAARLGYRTIILEPGADAPAAQLSNRHIVASYDDEAALMELADTCDVVTYEFENVPLSAAHFLEERVALCPPSQALAAAQDRLTEKTALQEAGIAIAPFEPVENADDLRIALQKLGGGVLKTRRFGYDGKGQHVFSTSSDSDVAAVLGSIGQGPFVLEKKIAFKSEFSVIAARGRDGTVVAFDPSTNVHEAGILRRCIVPALISEDTANRAMDVAQSLLAALDYVGVIGVEFFETEDGLLVNEFAPRVHNSGHWTSEACAVSQFEQHIRAISGHPLGATVRHHNCEMLNLIGEEGDDVSAWMEEEAATVTLYGKSESRAGRKMGHVTRLTGLASS